MGRSTLVAVRIVVKGYVQGVGYRYFILRQAQSLHLKGYVRNLTDGSVEIEAEGEKATVLDLIELSKRGPRLAQVDSTAIEWKEPKNLYSYFEIQ